MTSDARVLVAVFAVSFFGACGEDGGAEGACEPPADVDRLGAAAASWCAVPACNEESSVDDCRDDMVYDTVYQAVRSADPSSCLQAGAAWLECTAEARCAESCTAERDALDAACANTGPVGTEAFAGARAQCERVAACGGEDPPAEAAVRACLADELAALWTVGQWTEPSCACEYTAFRECVAAAALDCDASVEDEESACPGEAASLSACLDP